MEIIRKIISLRDFTEKFGASEPYINLGEESGGTSYGKIPYDIVVNGNVHANVPVVEHEGNSVVRFGTFAYYYNWLRNFIANSKYYYAANPKGVFTWAEFDPLLPVFSEGGTCVDEDLSKYCLFSSCEGVYSGLPEESTAYTCEDTIICVNENVETFIEMFYDISSACDFLDIFAASVLSGSYEISNPFIDIPILIDSMANDLGSEEYIDGEHESAITEEYLTYGDYFVESQLKTLLRKKTTVDSNGNVLDFVEVNGQNQLRYSIGTPQNFVYDGGMGAYTFNEITTIELYYDDGYDIELTSDTSLQLSLSDVNRTGKIIFHYTVGNLLLDLEDNIDTNGLEYIEEYLFSIKKSPYNNLPYLDIDYTSNIKPEWGEEDKQYAVVHIDVENFATYISSGLSSGSPIGNFIRRDVMIGSTEVGLRTGEIKIDRGASASYEALNVLGEVNSIEDIEKYRNDWYQIKGKND